LFSFAKELRQIEASAYSVDHVIGLALFYCPKPGDDLVLRITRFERSSE